MATSQRIRIKGNITGNYDNPIDLYTNETAIFLEGNDTAVEVSLFDRNQFQSLSNLTTAILQIKELVNGDAPDEDNAPIIQEILTSASDGWDAGATLTEWKNQTGQHFTFNITSAQLNQTPGNKWLACYVTTNDLPSKVITLFSGHCKIKEDGTGTTGTPPTPANVYYNKTESDTRYLRFADTSFLGTDAYLHYYLYREEIVGEDYFNLSYQPAQEGIYLDASTRVQFEVRVLIYNETTTLGHFKLSFSAGRYNVSTVLSDVFYEIIYRTSRIDTSDVEVFIEDYQLKIKVKGKTGVTCNAVALVSAMTIEEKTIDTSEDFGSGVFNEKITTDFRVLVDETTTGVYEGNLNTEEITTDFDLEVDETTTGVYEGNLNTEEITTDFNITVKETTP